MTFLLFCPGAHHDLKLGLVERHEAEVEAGEEAGEAEEEGEED